MRHNILTFLLILLTAVSCKQDIYYTLEVSCNPSEGGSASPLTGSFLEGETVSIKAIPSAEYLFEGWSGDASGSSNPLSIVMDSDKSVVANFIKKTYSLAIEVEGSGHVEERLMGTKSDYESGSIVELTAVPDEYWKFDHWEGDITGSDNPTNINVTNSKSAKAVFVKPSYSYRLNIVGPGAVDEYLVERTKGVFESGTIINLKSSPNRNAVFVGWGGDVSSTAADLSVEMDSDKEIIAYFEKKSALKYALPNLKQPWGMIKCLYSEIDCSDFAIGSPEMLRVDYNRDGYIDIITATSSQEGNYESDCPVHFYLGQADGSFVVDPKNDGRITGKLPRKMMYCDFNGDDLPDITLAGHGSEIPGVEGTYPMILMSRNDGTYQEMRFPELFGYHHGSSLGDFDNDGDVDFFVLDSFHGNTAFLLNDGKGNFTIDKTRTLAGTGLYTCELFDINQDGFLDLIWAGSNFDPKWDDGRWGCQIIWGNSDTYNLTNKITTLPAHVSGQEIFIDFEFCDLNGDGNIEIIANTTSCGTTYENYGCWGFEVFERRGDEYVNATFDYFEDGENIGLNEPWHAWIDIEKVCDRIFLTGDGTTYFELVQGRFVRYRNEYSPESGIAIYSDGIGTVESMGYVDLGCHEYPYSGNTCMKFTDWGMYTGLNIELNGSVLNGTDLSYLKDAGYVLEFYIKNINPDLQIHFKFMSIVEPEDATYCYVYDGHDHKCDGNWERVIIPLKDFDAWDSREDFWKKINHFNVIICSDGGPDFYLDEIRIRKIVDLG